MQARANKKPFIEFFINMKTNMKKFERELAAVVEFRFRTVGKKKRKPGKSLSKKCFFLMSNSEICPRPGSKNSLKVTSDNSPKR